jgi:hypothetical protein
MILMAVVLQGVSFRDWILFSSKKGVKEIN